MFASLAFSDSFTCRPERVTIPSLYTEEANGGCALSVFISGVMLSLSVVVSSSRITGVRLSCPS